MPAIFIGGYYGANNIGDDAILGTIIHSLQKQRNDLRFIVASFNPDITRAKFNVESVHWRHISELASCVQRADLVVVGGGGLFQDYWGIEPNTYLRSMHGGITTYGTLPKLADLFGIPCMLYAVGVGPLFSEESRQQTKEIFSLCATSTLRDQNSEQLLRETGYDGTTEVTADPVFGLEVTEEDRQHTATILNEIEWKASSPLVAVSLRYWEQDISPTNWTNSLAAQLDKFIQRTDAHLLFTPFQDDPESQFTNDTALNQAVAGKIVNSRNIHVVEKILRPGEMQSLYDQCEMVIAMRLHASILSVNAGTPVFAIAYDPKVISLMEEFELQDCTTSLKTLDQFDARLAASWQKRETLKNAILVHRPILQARAGRNTEIALHLLESHQSKAKDKKAVEFALERIRQMELMDEELSALKQSLASLKTQMDELTTKKAQLEARLYEIESSRGWKLLERLKGLRKRITHLMGK